MSESPFGNLAEVYDALVDWSKRLAREEPFYRRVFEEVGAKRVLDAACGSGRHAAMFHAWGLRVEGADLSPEMIELARRRVGEPPGLHWVVRGFDQPVESGPFDAAVCVGNSLALAPDRKTAAEAVRQLLAAVRPGGAVVVHLLNLWRLPDGPSVWQKIRWMEVEGRKLLLVKGVHRCGAGGFVDLVVVPADAESPPHTESAPLLGIEAAELEQMARDAGAAAISVHGDYHRTPYDRRKSSDIILLARK